MDEYKFHEIIDFAVEREQEAVAFYRSLQEMVKFDSQRELLQEFELMEQNHIEILENLRHTNLNHISIPRVEDLMISNYVVETKPDPEMNYQEIITTAMKREEASYNLYTDLAGKSEDEEVKKVFLKLAGEEAKHKLHFEQIYDQDILQEN